MPFLNALSSRSPATKNIKWISEFVIFLKSIYLHLSPQKFSENTSSFHWMSRGSDRTNFHSMNDLETFHNKHRFPRQPHQRFPPFFDIFLYRYCRLPMPNFLSSEHFCNKMLKVKLDMKTSFESLLDIALSRNSTDQKEPSCRVMVPLTDICLACRQALLGHGDTVYLFATENNFYHSGDILQQILSFLCFRKGRISFWEDKRSTAHELRVLKNQRSCALIINNLFTL